MSKSTDKKDKKDEVELKKTTEVSILPLKVFTKIPLGRRRC